MTAPLETTNPQDFKLRIYWIVGFKNKRMVAEFHDCKWLPRIGETLVLPIKEEGKSWHKFKVVDIVYDFQQQAVQAWCKPKDATLEKTTFSDSEKDLLHIAARRGAVEAVQRLEKMEQLAQQQYQPVKRIEVNVDKELERLKAEMAEQQKQMAQQQEDKPLVQLKDVDEGLERLKAQILELQEKGRSPNL